jgi:hypothetical protein
MLEENGPHGKHTLILKTDGMTVISGAAAQKIARGWRPRPVRWPADRHRVAGLLSEAVECHEVVDLFAFGHDAVDRMAQVGIAERHPGDYVLILGHAEHTPRHRPEHVPGPLRTGIETAILGREHQRLHEHANVEKSH